MRLFEAYGGIFMIIKDIEEINETPLEGTMYSEIFNCGIDVVIGEYSENPKKLLPYAEKCAEEFNTLSQKLIDEICEAAKRFYIHFIDKIDEEWENEVKDRMSVEINDDTDAKEILNCFTLYTLSIEEPNDERIGYRISGSCEWDSEHGIEIAILDEKLVYLGPFLCTDPWNVYDSEWNFIHKQ